MNANEIIALFVADGAERGDTCDAMTDGLVFRECCGSMTPGYDCREFIARGPRGGVVYLCHNRTPDSEGRTWYTFGPKGYHFRNETTPCV